MTNDCKTCPVSTGTHKPAEAVHQIDEPQTDALDLADKLEKDVWQATPLRLSKVVELAAEALRAQSARIAELESQLEAIGAGGVEPLRKQAEDGWIQEGPLLYRLTDERRPKNRDEIIVTMANSSRTEEARTRRAGELLDAIRAAAPQECSRSHPHEEMTPMCELRTEISRLTNALARAEAAAPQAVQAAVPEGWVPCVITYEGQHPEEIAYGPQAMMDRLKKWLDRYFEMRTAPAHPAEGVPAQAEPFMWAIQEPGGSAYMDENCVSTSRGIVEAEVDGLNLGLGADDEPYKVVPVYLAATQPAAQGMEAQQYRLIQRGELIEAGDQFLRDDFTWQIDPRGIFVGVPYGAALRPARRALAAQAKQGGAANG